LLTAGCIVALADLSAVMRGHSRPKDGVASLAYDPRIHLLAKNDGLPGHARQ
jgi:hypothetical protein